jgi:hypothetical protein
MKNRVITRTEKKLLDYIGKKLAVVANSRFETVAEIQELERLGIAAGRFAEWLEEEQVDVELDEVKCAMICEALDYPDLRRSGDTLVWHYGQLLMRQVLNIRPVDQQILRCPSKEAV